MQLLTNSKALSSGDLDIVAAKAIHERLYQHNDTLIEPLVTKVGQDLNFQLNANELATICNFVRFRELANLDKKKAFRRVDISDQSQHLARKDYEHFYSKNDFTFVFDDEVESLCLYPAKFRTFPYTAFRNWIRTIPYLPDRTYRDLLINHGVLHLDFNQRLVERHLLTFASKKGWLVYQLHGDYLADCVSMFANPTDFALVCNVGSVAPGSQYASLREEAVVVATFALLGFSVFDRSYFPLHLLLQKCGVMNTYNCGVKFPFVSIKRTADVSQQVFTSVYYQTFDNPAFDFVPEDLMFTVANRAKVPENLLRHVIEKVDEDKFLKML